MGSNYPPGVTGSERWKAIVKLRQDASDVDYAAAILHERGAMKLAEQVRKRVKEWMEQSDEMERRA